MKSKQSSQSGGAGSGVNRWTEMHFDSQNQKVDYMALYGTGLW